MRINLVTLIISLGIIGCWILVGVSEYFKVYYSRTLLIAV